MWLVVWACYFRNHPKDHLSESGNASIPWLSLARCILPVTLVDFCYGWTLWLFLTWIPSFFLENYHLNLQASAMFSVGVLSAGVVGNTVGGIVSDRLLRRTGSLLVARRSVIVTGFLGAVVFLLPVILVRNLTVAAAGLALAFFFAELIVAPIWAVPMDIAPQYSGTASLEHDELWIRGRGPDFALEFWLPGGPYRQLGGSVDRLGGPASGRRGGLHRLRPQPPVPGVPAYDFSR